METFIHKDLKTRIIEAYKLRRNAKRHIPIYYSTREKAHKI